ncbi:MAG: alpha/beta hydrolase, partial [Streptococcaceae bacterium]|nr:alpha/beta hydrolase [Streptococcaceae bacterium]
LELEEHFFSLPNIEGKRRVRVLLPNEYKTRQGESFPVLYLHDGQNIFYSKEAYAGYSWKIIKLLKKHQDLADVIVVAVDNSGFDRYFEYTPFETPGEASVENSGGGEDYAEWFVSTLKPFIDSTYRTKSDRENTLLAGSSLGGLIAAYQGSRNPEIFGNLGIFSLASFLSEREFLTYVQEHPLHPDTRVYIQVGTEEGNDTDESLSGKDINQAYIDSSIYYVRALLMGQTPLENLHLHIFSGEHHGEYYWAKHFEEFLRFSNGSYVREFEQPLN